MSANMPAESAAESVASASPNQLDRLIGLCEEISALARTGLPLEESLLLKSQTEQNKTAKQLQELAERLGTGQSLADAVREDPAFPPVFAAVVESGIKSGNLTAALDSLIDCIRSLRDARLFIIRSTLYPLVLFTSLWFVFVFLVAFLAPQYALFFEAYGQHFVLADAVHRLEGNRLAVWVLALGIPAFIWTGYCFWTIRSARSDTVQSVGNSLLFRWFPWIGQATIEMQKTAFARIFATLIRSSIPLDQAILLAAKSCNDRYWAKETLETLRRRIVDGKVHKAAAPSAVSPLIEWSLGIPDEKMLLEGIDHYAVMSRSRSGLLLAKCGMFLPAALTLIVAVLVGCCYVLAVFVPYMQMLNFLSHPVIH